MKLRKRQSSISYTPLDGKAVLRLLRKPNIHHRMNKSLGSLSIQTAPSHCIYMRPHVHTGPRTGFFLSVFRLKRSTDLPHLHARCASRPSHPPNHPNLSSDSKHHEAPHYITFFVFTLLLVSHIQTFFSAMRLNCQTLIIMFQVTTHFLCFFDFR